MLQNVQREQARSRKMKVDIKQEFWLELIGKHRLTGMVIDGLVAPVDEERVRPELDEAMRMAHDANPAKRSGV